jgi:predicted dithiol-disulfide oxidoreductase (DUF899 family)
MWGYVLCSKEEIQEKDDEIARLRRELGTKTTASEHSIFDGPIPPSERIASRKELLQSEKELSKRAAKLAMERRQLPQYELSTKELSDYAFEQTGDGQKVSLTELFDQGSTELIIYHMMFGADAKKLCSLCSFFIDQFVAAVPHLQARGVSFVVIGKGSWENITNALSNRLERFAVCVR